MAGIGFELKKVMDGEKNFEKVGAAVKSMFITSGPWIISVLTMIFLKYFLDEVKLTKDVSDRFFSIMAYIFIFSGILASPAISLITRYLADILYVKKDRLIIPILNAGLLLLGLTAFIISYSFIIIRSDEIEIAYEIASTFTALSCLWLVMVFVSTLKDYTLVSNSFLIGMLCTALIVVYTENVNVENLLIGFKMGILIIMGILIAKFLNTYEIEKIFDFNFLKKGKYLVLFITSLILNLGLWIDKFIYWGSSFGEEKIKGFYFLHNYDLTLFVSYLVTVPALAYFTIFIETELFKRQHKYFKAIENGSDWETISMYEKKLNEVFENSFLKLIIFQIGLSLMFVIHVQYFIELLGLDLSLIPLFRVVILAIFTQMLLTIVIVFLYYFDFQKEVLFLSIFLLVSNIISTLVLLRFGEDYVGYSFLISLGLTLLYGLKISIYKLKRVSFYTFMNNEI